MINIKREEKERCKTDPSFLRSILEKELESTRDSLEVLKDDELLKAQGKAKAYRNVVELLR